MDSTMTDRKKKIGQIVSNVQPTEPEVPVDNSNIAAAVERVASNMTNMSVKPIAEKNDDGPSDCQVLIRTMSGSRDRWKLAAEKSGLTLSSWIRETLNKSSDELLDCQHPIALQRFYPWAHVCTACGYRFKKV